MFAKIGCQYPTSHACTYNANVKLIYVVHPDFFWTLNNYCRETKLPRLLFGIPISVGKTTKRCVIARLCEAIPMLLATGRNATTGPLSLRDCFRPKAAFAMTHTFIFSPNTGSASPTNRFLPLTTIWLGWGALKKHRLLNGSFQQYVGIIFYIVQCLNNPV